MKNFLVMTIALLGLTQLVMSVILYVRHAPLTESAQTDDSGIAPFPDQQESIKKATHESSDRPSTNVQEPKRLSADLDDRARLDISTRKRDPFVPFYSLGESQAPSPNAPLTAFDLGELRVTAIIKDSAGAYSASIETKSGKNFIVQRGIQIGTRGGQIVDISSSKVIVSELLKDNAGKRRVQFSELTLRSTKPVEGMTAAQ